jgi:hypothetical protein
MDEKQQHDQDVALAQELLRNERVIPHPKFGDVRLRRLTGEEELFVANERRRRYQADMRDREILSRAELEKLAMERGMWSPADAKKYTELSVRMGEAMGILEHVGFKTVEALRADYRLAVDKIVALFGEDEKARDAAHRYFNLIEKPKGADRAIIHAHATTSDIDDLMLAAEALRTQIDLLIELTKVREELDELTSKQVRLFVDSIESRTDRAEEMARVYMGAVHAATGQPLWPTFAEMWKAPPQDVEVLVLEMHYFLHGITDEFKATLGKYGFIRRLPVTSDSSADSPGQPQSNSDGESVASGPAISSEATASTAAS